MPLQDNSGNSDDDGQCEPEYSNHRFYRKKQGRYIDVETSVHRAFDEKITHLHQHQQDAQHKNRPVHFLVQIKIYA